MPQNQSKKNSKKFQKKSKNDENFFSLFLFLLCSIECIVSSRLDTMTIKPFLPPLYSQTARQITFENDVEKSLKIIKKSKNVEKNFFLIENLFYQYLMSETRF